MIVMIVIDELEPTELLLTTLVELLLTAPTELLLTTPVELLLTTPVELLLTTPTEELLLTAPTELLLLLEDDEFTAPELEDVAATKFEEELPFKLEELEFFLATSSSLGKLGESLSAQDKNKANTKAANAILYNFTILTSISNIKVETFLHFVKGILIFFLNRHF
jgi:hypothetical protein